MLQEIKNDLHDLSNEEKSIVKENFLFLCNQLLCISGRPDPWLLFIDNQILIDIQHSQVNKFSDTNRKRYIRLLALYFILDFLNNYSGMKVSLVLTPCLYYEFNRKEIPANRKEYTSCLSDCISLLKQFEVDEILTPGLENYQTSRVNIKGINHDEKQILRSIYKLEMSNLEFELYHKLANNNDFRNIIGIQLIKPPLLAAYHLVYKQKLNLRYFDREIINHIIACHLEEKIYRDSAKTHSLKLKLKPFRGDFIGKTASISKVSKGKLKGLADIEMMQYCNLSVQFDKEMDYTAFPLTFDNKLAQLLKNGTFLNATMNINSEDSDTERKININKWFNRIDKINLIERKEEQLFDKLMNYCRNNVIPIL